MSELSMGLAAAFAAGNVTLFGALKVEFPDHTLLLLDGSAVLAIGSDIYVGRDTIWGVCSSISEFSDGDATQAPHMVLTFQPPTNTAAANLTAATNQGAAVTIMVGAVNRVTGQVIPDPYVLFVGEWDVGTLTASKGDRAVSAEIVSIFERLFEQDEGARLTDAWLQSIWPGALGLQFHTVDPSNLPWGKSGVRDVTSGASTYAITDMAMATLRSLGFYS